MDKSRAKKPPTQWMCHCSVSQLTLSVQNITTKPICSPYCFLIFFYRKSLAFLKHNTGTLYSCQWIFNPQKCYLFCLLTSFSLGDTIFLQKDLKKACMKCLLGNNLAVGIDFCFGKLTYVKAEHEVTINWHRRATVSYILELY